jgi:hypothetical protein
MTSDVVAEGTLLGQREIARFYFPLALTSILSMALGPLVTFGLGRGGAPLPSLAVWPVVTSMIFLFRSGGVAFQEVGIALDSDREVGRTAVLLGSCASLALALVALTPLETVWFERLTGLTHDLAIFAVWPVRILILYPMLEYILSFQRAQWIVAHRTGVITISTAIEAIVLAAVLAIAIGRFGLIGAVAGAMALLVGRVASSGYLLAARAQVR